MIKLFEEYDNRPSKMESIASDIGSLFWKIFPDLKIWNIATISQWVGNNSDTCRFCVYKNPHQLPSGANIIFKVDMTSADSMSNDNKYINFEIEWGWKMTDSDKFDDFVKFLKYTISPTGFYSISTRDINSFVSKLTIEEYEMFLDSGKYNL